MVLDESVCSKVDEEKCKIVVVEYLLFKNDLSIGV